MTTYSWKSGTTADWSVGTDWTPAGPANSATADAVIAGSGGFTVTIAAAESFLVDSLTFTPAAAVVLTVDGTLTLGGTEAAMTIGSGTVKLAGGTMTGGTITMTGGTLSGTAGGTIASALVVSAGTLTVANSTTLTLAGATTLTGGALVKGGGTLDTTGTTTVTGNAELDASLVWANGGTVLAGAEIYTGYPSGAGKVSISNLAGGVFDLTADGAAFLVQGSSTLVLSNAGVLSKTGGTGTSNISVAVANTGTITATSGTLELDGGGTLSGTIGATGSGALALGGGTYSVTGATQTVSGALLLDGGTVKIGSGDTLTLSGAVAWSGGDVTGPGTLATTGTTTLSNGVYIDGALIWSNSGTVLDGTTIYTDGYVGSTYTVANQATGTFDITGNGTAFFNYATATTFTNAGLLEKTGGTGISTVSVAVTNTGTITVASGTLELQGTVINTGAVTATAGTLVLDGGGTLGGTVGATGTGALALAAGTFSLTGVTQTVSGELLLDGGTVKIGSGDTLTLSGAVAWSGGDVTGPGTLATTGTTTLSNGVYIDGALIWSNSGTVLDGTTIYTDGYVGSTYTVANQATGTFDITGNGAAFFNYAAATTFTNAGLLEKTGGSGISTVSVAVANTGTVTVASGTLELDGGGTLGGTIGASGAGTLALGGGTYSLTGATQAISGALLLDGGTVKIGSGDTLTLSGPVTWSGSDVTGPGTLATTGTTTIANGYAYLDGGLTWINSGTVLDGYYSYSGANVAGTNTVINQAGAVFDITADDYAFNPGAPTTFTNAGLLEKTGTTGTTNFYASLTNTGTITAASGTLALDGGGTLGGTIGASGAGTLALGGGTYSLTGATQAISGALLLDGGTVKIGSGDTLTLSGPVTWSGSDVTGPGTLATTGTTTIANGYAYLDGGLTWINSGTVLDGYYSYSGANVAGTNTVINQAGAVFDITADDYAFNPGAPTTFTNAGLLEKTGTTGTTNFYASVTNTGTVTATSGTLELDGGGTLAGTVGGAGTGNVLLGANQAFTTSGTLAVTDAGTTDNDLRIAYSDTWTVTGTVNDAGRIQVGNNTGTAGTLAIAAGAHFNLTSSDATLIGNGKWVVTNAGVLAKTAGTGTSNISLSLTNTGTIDAASGTLKVSGAIGGTGRLQIESAATLELTASTVPGNNTIDFDGLGATLRLDANFAPAKAMLGLGAGSRIDLAAASGATAVINGNTLTITPTGGTALSFVGASSLTGLHVTTGSDGGGGTVVTLYQQAVAAPHAPEPVAFGSVHVGAVVQQGVTITNAATAGAYAENLDASLTSSATGFVASGSLTGLGGGASNGTALTVALNTGSAGTISGAGTLTLASDGAGVDGYGQTPLASQTVNVTGAVYAYAAPVLSAGSIALGAARVGGTALAGSVVLADGTVATPYQESLLYQLGTALPSGFVLGNGGGTLVAGQTVSIGVTLNTATAGDFTGTALGAGASGASFVSTGAGTSGLANTTLATPTLTVSGQVYATATAALSAGVVNFGAVHVGDVVNAATLTLSNTASGALTDILTGGTASETGGYTGTVTPNTGGGLVAGGASGSVTFGLATTTAGAQNGTVNLGFLSHDGVLSDVGVNAAPVSVTAAVYAYAAPVLSGTTIALGAVRAGGAALVGGVTLGDGTVATAYQESLLYQLGTSLPASLVVSNAGGTLVAGQTVGIGVTLNTTTAGDFTNTALGSGATGASFVSTGAGTSGLANTTLATPTLTVSGQVYATATASLSATVVNFGVVHVGDVVNLATLTLTNGAVGALTDLLAGGTATEIGGYTGTVTPNTGGGLAAGASGSVTFGLGTGSSGVQSGTVDLGFLSHDGVLSDVGVNAAPVSVTGTVDSYATATIEDFTGQTITGSGSNYTVNLGTLTQNGAMGILTLAMLNSATGLSDLLSGSFSITAGSGFTNVGFGPFSGLGAGQAAGGDTIELATGTAGTFTETIVINSAGSNADYNGALPTETLTVSGVVNPSNIGPTYYLTPAPTSITATVGNDTFIATNGALNSRDYITAGPGGGNLLVLSGAGVFDLNAPKTLANIDTVSATEGQVAGGGQPDTTQTVFLRDGLNVTLTVGSGAINPSNPNPASIVIYGGNDSSVMNLGTGHDTVVLGSAHEVVNGNTSGVDLVQTTTAFAGAVVKGTAGDSMTLEVTNAGTATLSVSSTYATVQIDQASVITLSKASFITAVGETAGNTITALAKNQTLGGVAGSDTLVGYTGFTDTFKGASAGLNNDTIKNFGGTGTAADVIDVTDLSYASALKSYTPGSGQGVLGLTDGTHSTSITLVGSYTLASFQLATDNHGGTLVKFV